MELAALWAGVVRIEDQSYGKDECLLLGGNALSILRKTATSYLPNFLVDTFAVWRR